MLLRDITLIDENYAAKPHANILVEDGRIAALLDEAPKDYSGEVYDGAGKIAAPGFYNCHCHVPMGLLRGYGEGLPLHRWLFERMFPYEARITAEDMVWGALLGIAEMLSSGAVSFTDMYFEMPQVAKAVMESGIKANLSHGAAADDPEAPYAGSRGHAGTLALLEAAKPSGGRIITDVGLHAEYTAAPRLCRELAEFAKEKGLRIHLHLSETQKEHEEAKERRGTTPARWFAGLGVFDVPVTAAHCVWVDEGDIALLAKHGVTAVHCPSSNLKLGSGIAPLRALREAGVRVAVGTDGAASNNNLNMLEEVNLAALVQKGTQHDPLFLSMAEIFEMATKNGALAQGRADCGAIQVGNKADIVVYTTDAPNMLPVIDPASNLLYAADKSNIVLNMIDGKVVYKNGEYLTMDIEKVKYNAQRIARRIVGELGE